MKKKIEASSTFFHTAKTILLKYLKIELDIDLKIILLDRNT